MPIYPYINPSIQVDLPQPDAETRLILNHQSGRYVRLGPREYNWLIRLDGQTHRDGIATLLEMESAFAAEFLRRLESAKLILLSETPVRITLTEQKAPSATPHRAFEWMEFAQLRIRIARAELLLGRLARIRLLKNRLFIAATTWVSLMGIVAALRLLQVTHFTTLLQTFVPRTSAIVALVSLIFLTSAIHELGHAVVCTMFGAPVRSMGIMIYYLQPAAYADVTDSWQLKNKWHRVAISAAGIYIQAFANAVAVAVLLALRVAGWHSDLLLLYIAMNLSTMAFNLIPFVKLDGYWMLSAMLAIPNLRDRALEWFQVLVMSKVTRKPVNEKTLRYSSVLQMTPMGRTLLACFGASSRSFGIAMWAAGLSFLFRVSRWMGLSTGRGYIFVGLLLLLGGTAFVVRFVRARRRPTKAVVAPVPAPTAAAAVTYNIDRMRAIRLNPFAIVMDDLKGTFTFAWTSADQLSVHGTAKMFDLIPSLRHGIRLCDMEQGDGLDAHTENVLQRLWHSKHLRYSTDWDLKEDEKRYSRQLGWFSLNIAVRGSERSVLSSLKMKSVTILGVGGVGSNVALNLAACGIGELHLVDGDTVELTNLNRQLLYTPDDIGHSKIEVAAAKLTTFNPALKVRTTNRFLNSVSDVMQAIEGSDFVVRALDTPAEAQAWVNEACVRKNIPSSGAGFLAQGAIVGPTVIPGLTGCLACQQAELPRFDRGMGGTLAPIVTVTAGILANEVITYLGQLGQVRTMKGMLLIEAPTFATYLQEIARNESCVICGTRKEVAV